MRKLMIMLLMILAIGCTKKHVKAPEEPVKQGSESQSGTMVEEQVSSNDEDDMESSGIKGNLFGLKDVLFDYDKYDIRSDARAVLDSFAANLKQNGGINVVIEGHCDEMGTNEYNLALGERRAKAVKTYLNTIGVAPKRMRTVTYGEEKPVCTDHNEACWQKNRRAHIVDVR